MPGADAYVAPEGAPTALIVDIDGTLAIRGTGPDARLWHDWDRVGEDDVNWPIFHVMTALHDAYTSDIIFVSGRKDVCRDETMKWLKEKLAIVLVEPPLFMRRSDDNRPDYVVKREIFDQHIRHNYDVKFVIDDRETVVAMWRSLGLTVLQVAEGKF